MHAGPRRPARFIVFIKRINLISLRGCRLDKALSIGLTGHTRERQRNPPSPHTRHCGHSREPRLFQGQAGKPGKREVWQLISISGENVEGTLLWLVFSMESVQLLDSCSTVAEILHVDVIKRTF